MKRTITFSVRADVCDLAALAACALERGLLVTGVPVMHPRALSLAAIERVARDSAVTAIPGHRARFSNPASAWHYLTEIGLVSAQAPNADRSQGLIPIPDIAVIARDPQAVGAVGGANKLLDITPALTLQLGQESED